MKTKSDHNYFMNLIRMGPVGWISILAPLVAVWGMVFLLTSR